MTTKKRRGRKPNDDEKRDIIESECDDITAFARKARTYECLRVAAHMLLKMVKKQLLPDKRKGSAGDSAINRAALCVLIRCGELECPPPLALATAFEVLLRLDEKNDIYNRSNWLAAVHFVARLPADEDIAPQRLAKSVGVSWATAKKWLADPNFKAAVGRKRPHIDSGLFDVVKRAAAETTH